MLVVPLNVSHLSEIILFINYSCIYLSSGPHSTVSRCPPNEYQCGGTELCIHMSKLCNGVPDCTNGWDEGAHCRGNRTEAFVQCVCETLVLVGVPYWTFLSSKICTMWSLGLSCLNTVLGWAFFGLFETWATLFIISQPNALCLKHPLCGVPRVWVGTVISLLFLRRGSRNSKVGASLQRLVIYR